jgi:hypothetical protein
MTPFAATIKPNLTNSSSGKCGSVLNNGTWICERWLGGQAEEEELCTWEMDVYGSLRGVF